MQGLLEHAKFLNVCTATEGAAGTDDITTDTVDTAGFDEVTWVVTLGAITANAVTSVKLQQDTDSAMGTAADLEGTSITIADDDDGQLVLTAIIRPTERYVRMIVDRGTQNAVVENITAILTNSREVPITHSTTTVVAAETHLSPAEGTA